MNLEFFVKDKRITRKGFQPVVADTTGHYTFTIEFDREWDGLVKVVVFQNGGETAERIYTGQDWLPDNVSKRGDLYVACHGYKKLGDSVAVVRTVRMTRPVRILEPGLKAGGEPERYTPTVFEQVMAAAGAANTAAQEANQARTDLLAAKESGELNGRAATVAVGTVETGEAGTDASVTNVGTQTAAVLNFVLPRGAAGPQGADGPAGPQGPQGGNGRGIASITGNADGSWTIAYDDGTAETVSSEAYEALQAGLDQTVRTINGVGPDETGNVDVGSQENAMLFGIGETTVALPVSDGWRPVAYGNGRFVTVAFGSDAAAYSDDGFRWFQATLPVSAYWTSAAYGNGHFVAVVGNDSDICAYSEDGVTWTQGTLPVSADWKKVIYGSGKFIAIANDSNVFAYSEDGVAWLQGTLPASAGWNSIAYGNGRFVVLTNDDANVAAYSDDGVTWTKTTLPKALTWGDITYGNGRFVAVANHTTNHGTYFDTISATRIAAYSDDGVTWTQTEMPAACWSSIAFGNGRFVAVGQSVGSGGFGTAASKLAAYSDDGITWVQTSLPEIGMWNIGAYGNCQFVAVGYLSDAVAYTYDGITWQNKEPAILDGDGNIITEHVKAVLDVPAGISEAPPQAGAGGANGKDGGYYTPSVTQPDANTMRVSFTPSDASMPGVEDKDVTLPAGAAGATPNIQIGTVETLEAGSPATASMTGTAENPLLNLGIPQGGPGGAADASGGKCNEWKLIREITIPDDPSADESGITWATTAAAVKGFEFDADDEGNLFELSEIYVRTNVTNTSDQTAATTASIDVNGKGLSYIGAISPMSLPCGATGKSGRNWWWLQSLNPLIVLHGAWLETNTASGKTLYCYQPNDLNGVNPNPYAAEEKITSVNIFGPTSTSFFAAGSIFEVYGR